MKKIVLALCCTGVVAYGGVVAFLQHFDHEHAPVLSENSPTRHNPEALAAFNIISGARCDYCHAEGRQLPFYFNLLMGRKWEMIKEDFFLLLNPQVCLLGFNCGKIHIAGKCA